MDSLKFTPEPGMTDTEIALARLTHRNAYVTLVIEDTRDDNPYVPMNAEDLDNLRRSAERHWWLTNPVK